MDILSGAAFKDVLPGFSGVLRMVLFGLFALAS
jgi:hypothetical protein